MTLCTDLDLIFGECGQSGKLVVDIYTYICWIFIRLTIFQHQHDSLQVGAGHLEMKTRPRVYKVKKGDGGMELFKQDSTAY